MATKIQIQILYSHCEGKYRRIQLHFMSKSSHKNFVHKNLVQLVTCASKEVGSISVQLNKLNEVFYGVFKLLKITHKLLLK
jgi:hypothetical protein